MPRTWVTFKDKFGTVLGMDIEMDNIPRQGEAVMFAGTVYTVYRVLWEITPSGYRTVNIYLRPENKL